MLEGTAKIAGRGVITSRTILSPNSKAERTRARFQFESNEDFTVVRLTQTGWRKGAEWDHAYQYLTVGNAQLLATLCRRFVSGPIDWKKEWGEDADKPAK